MQTARVILRAGLDRDAGLDLTDQGLIIAALEDEDGNICAAARRLRMHRNTLNRRILELDLRDLPKTLREIAKERARAKQMSFTFMREPGKKPRSITRAGGCRNAA